MSDELKNLSCPKCKSKNYDIVSGVRHHEREYKNGKRVESRATFDKKIYFYCKDCNLEGTVIGDTIFPRRY